MRKKVLQSLFKHFLCVLDVLHHIQSLSKCLFDKLNYRVTTYYETISFKNFKMFKTTIQYPLLMFYI